MFEKRIDGFVAQFYTATTIEQQEEPENEVMPLEIRALLKTMKMFLLNQMGFLNQET